MSKDTQSRKYQITQNNPDENEMGHKKIKELLKSIKSFKYLCMGDEKGQTYHTHIFAVFNNGVRFSTLKKKFPNAHIEVARGTTNQNRDYILKEGKWTKDKKHGTSIPGTFEECGEIPTESQGIRTDLQDLYARIREGATNFEILEENPDHMLKITDIDRARLTILQESFKNTFRQLKVAYICGPTGVGKTRFVMEHFGYSNVYRVNDYRHPFDMYQGEDVLLFDEFRSQILISQMLDYLDGYPLYLSARYSNKVACFTKVFIISNEPLNCQYPMIQEEKPQTWQALLRRIHHVFDYDTLLTRYKTKHKVFNHISSQYPEEENKNEET